MRIGVNVTWLTPGKSGGMESYIRNLITQLGKIDSKNEYYLFASFNNFRSFELPTSNWHMLVYHGLETNPISLVMLPESGYWFTNHRLERVRSILRHVWAFPNTLIHGHLSDAIQELGLDIWFCPIAYSLPVDIEIPVVNTIPDLQHEQFPNFFQDVELARRVMGYPFSCKAATATLAISETVRNQIIELYGVDRERVFATPLALGADFHMDRSETENAAEQASVKYRLEQPFIYYPSYGWRHKNHENLVKALAYVRERGAPLSLVLTGAKFDVMDRIGAVLVQSGLEKYVKHLGFIPRRDVIGVFHSASMVVFPSLFEGFGLPVLEAMACGIPVVCSPVGSLREVGGEAVLYCDPASPQDMGAKILQVYENTALRNQLIKAGRRRSEKFSFRRTASQTLSVFSKVAGGQLEHQRLPQFRPLRPGNWLMDGHSRWYFQCRSIGEIEIEVIQPTNLSGLINQMVSVIANGKQVDSVELQPMQPQKIVIPGAAFHDRGANSIDVIAERKVALKDRIYSVQIKGLTIIRESGERLPLIQGG